MTSPATDSPVGRAASFLVLLLIAAALFYGVTLAANEYQQAKDAAAYYREANEDVRENNRLLREQNTALRTQLEDLVTYFEDQGRVVPSNLGGSGPPVSVIRRESQSSHSSEGGTERRIVRRHTASVQPAQPSSSAPSPQRETEAPAVKVPDPPKIPDLPDVPKVDVPDVPKPDLPGIPLNGVL
jgi:hypothetical protein